MKSICRIIAAALLTGTAASVFLFCSATEEGTNMTEQIGVSWTGTEWDGSTKGEYPNRNSDIVQIGREYARTDSVPYSTLSDAISGARDYHKELSPYISYISRTDWKFNIVDSPSAFDKSAFTEFYKPEFDVSEWDNLYVPSSWQSHGYDKPTYHARGGGYFGNFGNPRKTPYGEGGLPLPEAPTVYNPIGLYRHTFNVPADWDGSKIYINFEGVKSAYYLWINGIQVGYAEDSFTSDEFDITGYVKPGEENVIALKVYRWADSSWLEQQDMIDLSGIFRDVYLYCTPNVRVRDFEITTDFDKTFTDSTILVDVDFANYTESSADATVKFRLFDADGNEQTLSGNVVSKNLSAGEKITETLSIPFASPKKWSAETPYLYTAVLEETMDGKTVYESYLVGFRKITYKTNESGWWEGSTGDADLIRINGKPIMFRGVNRHDTHPTLGNAVPRETYLEDVKLMKENNINAVRTSHYPNDPYFLYLCDVYGIYVLSEANQEAHQWYDENNAGDESMTKYLTDAIVDREYNMVERDKNHSSIVMWSLGNESQAPTILKTILTDEYTNQNGETHVLHEYTKSRPWHYSCIVEAYGVDVGSSMYGSPVQLEDTVKRRTRPFIKCEYSHAMGSSIGNFFKFWEVFEKYPMAQGGFVWDFVDQTVHLTVPGTVTTALVPQNDDSYTVETTNCEQIEFDGKKALKGYAVFPNSSLVNVTGKSITIDTMVKLNPVDSTTDTHWEFITKGDQQFLLKARRLANASRIKFGLSFATVNESNQTTWTDLNYAPASDEENESYFTTWHRITGTYDGKTMRMYIDGELKATKDVELDINYYNYSFAINKNTQLTSRVTDAYVNYVKIFNTAKTIEEINAASYTDSDCVLWMDMAEAFVSKEFGGYEYDSYGGDWGDSISSGAFCANGIVYADRTPQPELFEVKHQHREIKFEAVDVEAGIFDVNNFFLFRNVSEDFVFTWNLLQNDKVVDTGTLDVSELANTSVTDGMPGKLRIKVPYSFDGVDIIPGSEYFIEFRVAYRNDEGLLKAGHEICREQYALNYIAPGRPEANDVSSFSDMAVSESENVLTFTGEDFVISFDKSKGVISEFKAEDGEGTLRDLIVPGSGPAGSFYRAPTQNDKSEPAVNPVEAAVKYHGDMAVSSVNVDNSNPKAVKITVEGNYEKVNNLGITLNYTIYANGQIKVDAEFRPNYSSTIPFIPIVGMQTTLPADFENIEYYGKGPFENYNDRSLGASLDKYFTTVEENYENYLVPGEMGNRTGVRYAALTDNDGFGLLVSANGEPFEMSALHYTPESLNGVRHIYQVEKLAETVLRINAAQLGVGGDTCSGGGYIPDDEFIPNADVYNYSYTLSVKRSDEDAMTKSMIKNEEATDKSHLQKSVDAARALDEDDYTKSTWENLQKAVKAADEVLAMETPTYDELDPAKDAVDSAIAALVSVAPINSVLEYETQFDPNNYTYNSYKDFYNALQSAKKIKSTSDSTTAEIEEAAELVENAVNNLITGEHKTPDGEINVFELNFVLKSSDTESITGYTRLSEYLYNQKYKEIERIIASPTSQEEVDAAVEEAKTISGILEKATVEILGSKLDVTGSDFAKFDSGPAWNNGSNTGDKAFDGNTSTFYDYEKDANGYTGVDLGEGNSYVIRGVKIYARINPGSASGGRDYERRTIGAMIQVSDDKETWKTLYTLESAATIEGSLFEFDNDTSYRYIRYFAPKGNCNVAEVEFYQAGGGTDKTLLKYAIEEATEASFEGKELENAKTVFGDVLSEQSEIDGTSIALLNALYPVPSYKVYGTVELVRDFEDSPYETAEYDGNAVIVLLQGEKVISLLNEKDLSKSCTDDGQTLLEFSFDVEEGEYSLIVEKNGYARYTGKASVTDGDVQLEIELIAGDIKESYDDKCGDGIIDIDDFIRVLRGFATGATLDVKKAVDINEDGLVNVSDLGLIKMNFGKSSYDVK